MSFIFCHLAFFYQLNAGVSPVETQNFASPGQKTQQRQAYPYPNSLRLVACETQDFASLLFACRDIKRTYPSCHINGVSPVETQNFASPEQKTQQRQANTHPNSLHILACETQDFASLLFACRDMKRTYPSCHINGVSPVETQNFASPEGKTQQRQTYPHLRLLHILACETQDFASLLWMVHV